MSEGELSTRLQEAIVEMDVVLEAIAEAKQPGRGSRKKALDLLADEPVLQEFLGGALLEIAGKMALHGCPPSAVRGMYHEAAFLLAVTFKSVRESYRQLYADLLPQSDLEESNAEPQVIDPGDKEPASEQGPDARDEDTLEQKEPT